MKKLSLILCGVLLCALVACGGDDTDNQENKNGFEITISPTEALIPTTDGLSNEGNMGNSEDYSDIWGDDTAILTPSEDGSENGEDITPTQGTEESGNESATPTPVKNNSGNSNETTPTPGITKEAVETPETTPTEAVLTVTPTSDAVPSTPTVSPTLTPESTTQETITPTPTTGGLDSGSGSAPLDDLNWGPLIPM